HRHEAGRRQRDAPARETVSIVVEHQLERRDDVIEIGERLAHAHHHDIGDRRTARSHPRRCFAGRHERAVRVPELADDLAPRQIAHCADIVYEPLMQPARNLPRAKRLLAAFGEKRGECIRVEVEQVDHLCFAHRLKMTLVGKKKSISVLAVSGPSEPWTALASIDSANAARIVPGAAFLGSVAPISSRLRAMAFSPSSTCTMTGPVVMKPTR